MQKLIKSHPEIVLVSVAVVLLATIIGYFSWGMSAVIFELNRALKTSVSQEKPGFDLQDAARLDLRGLVDTSTSTNTSSQ